jgi:hypothetical protein
METYEKTHFCASMCNKVHRVQKSIFSELHIEVQKSVLSEIRQHRK